MKLLTKIEIILTVFLVLTYVAESHLQVWLHAMFYSDPPREYLLQSQFKLITDVAWFASLFPWAIYTLIYVLVLFTHLKARKRSGHREGP